MSGRLAVAIALLLSAASCSSEPAPAPAVKARPNVVLLMADDMGWGDTGYNGNPVIETPNLDRMAREGLRFDRFYAASPVCSPTRASVLTGRSPQRTGIVGASRGFLRQEEWTLAEALKQQGYATGHFGKWHLGTMTTTMLDGRRGGRADAYSPPWLHGFDTSFSTETAVPTWNPMDLAPLRAHRGGNTQIPTRYWTGEATFATENLEGDDSRVIMDRVIDFIRDSAGADRPFLAVVWFHAPHEPVVAGPEYKRLYDGRVDDDQAHYAGAITAMDEQIGRLNGELRQLGIGEQTLVWFASDNGARRGSNRPFRGEKGSLLEGGIRVPSLLVWPSGVASPRVVDAPIGTNDIFPTLLEIAGASVDELPLPIDGIDLSSFIGDGREPLSRGIAFEHGTELAYVDGAYKIYSADGGRTFALFALDDDPVESIDIAGEQPELLDRMVAELDLWRASIGASAASR